MRDLPRHVVLGVIDHPWRYFGRKFSQDRLDSVDGGFGEIADHLGRVDLSEPTGHLGHPESDASNAR